VPYVRFSKPGLQGLLPKRIDLLKPEPTTAYVELAGGKNISFETGNWPSRPTASGRCRAWAKTCAGDRSRPIRAREGIDFFPLTVDYREYTYAGGRIPGGFHQARTNE